MRKSKPYFTLLIKEHGQWAIEFGDYDLDTIKDEQADLVYGGTFKKRDTKIIKSADTQAAIFEAVKALNEKEQSK